MFLARRPLGPMRMIRDELDRMVERYFGMAFILVVKSGEPASYLTAISHLDAYRQAWEAYGNGPATGGRGRFDTRLDPPIH